MRLALVVTLVSLTLTACGGAGTTQDEAPVASDSAAGVKGDLGKHFDPNHPPAELKGVIPGSDAALAAASYHHDNFVAQYKLRADNKDVFAVLGNVVDADFEVAVFDDKGALLASGTFFSFQAAKWIWDANAQLSTHTGGDDPEAVKAALGKSFDPNKPPADFKGKVPGVQAKIALASYANDNFSTVLQLKAGDVDVFAVLGNLVDADFEVAVLDHNGTLLASGTFFSFQDAKWRWDKKPQLKTHSG